MISSPGYSRLSKFYLAKWIKTWQCNRESNFAGVVALKKKMYPPFYRWFIHNVGFCSSWGLEQNRIHILPFKILHVLLPCQKLPPALQTMQLSHQHLSWRFVNVMLLVANEAYSCWPAAEIRNRLLRSGKLAALWIPLLFFSKNHSTLSLIGLQW